MCDFERAPTTLYVCERHDDYASTFAEL